MLVEQLLFLYMAGEQSPDEKKNQAMCHGTYACLWVSQILTIATVPPVRTVRVWRELSPQ